MHEHQVHRAPWREEPGASALLASPFHQQSRAVKIDQM